MSGIVNSTGARSGIIGTTEAPAVGTGTDGYVLTATGAGVNPAWEAAASGGIGQSTTFQLLSNVTSNEDITDWSGASNLDGAGAIGTLLTMSSGVVTLPVGVWLITSMFGLYHAADDNATVIQLKDGDGTVLTETFSYYLNPSYSYSSCVSINYVVQSDGTDGIKFHATSIGSGSYVYGTSGWTPNVSASQATFIKLTSTASSA